MSAATAGPTGQCNLQREWLQNRQNRPATVADGAFTVMTYNILNKDLCPEGLFPYCPDDLLTTGERHPLLMTEIDHHKDADIICMQEVSCNYYGDTLAPDMQLRGFAGVFIKRPNDRSPGDDRPWTDGNATFYRDARFQLVKQKGGDFNDLFEKEKEGCQLKPEGEEAILVSKLIDSRRSYLFTQFRCLKTDRLVAVGNVHLTCVFGKYQRMDLAALEAALATKELVHFGGGADSPHILCGDFNLEPHHPGYQLLHDGSLNEAMETYLRSSNRRGDTESNRGHEVPFSCYEDGSANCTTPEGGMPCKDLQVLYDAALHHEKDRKNDHKASGPRKYKAALDYIWFGSNLLHCDGVLKMIDEELILPFHACPNAVFPSDHLPIKAKFSYLSS